MNSKRRVVVTGLGVISPVGNNVNTAWQNILAGQSGISLIDSFDTSPFTTKFAGLIKNLKINDYFDSKEIKKIDPFIQYGIIAAEQAVQAAGLMNSDICQTRIGVAMGSGIGGIGTIQNTSNIFAKSGPRKISPFFIPSTIVNMISGHVSIKYSFKGPNLAVATACTTGTHSIGLAYRAIQYGDADVMIAGGAEKASTQLGIGGFASARALSSRNDDPTKASRPWDINRDGFVLGDGAASLVLEEYESAKKRGATIYAELVGYAMNADAYHITRTAPNGEGGAAVMRLAMLDAAVNSSDINYINAHATSTSVGDIDECTAIKTALGDAATTVSVSSTKSMTGHLLGAAGAIEALFTVLAIKEQVVPPTINLDEPDKGCDLDFVPHVPKDRVINFAISNSFGFGGTNAALIFRKIY